MRPYRTPCDGSDTYGEPSPPSPTSPGRFPLPDGTVRPDRSGRYGGDPQWAVRLTPPADRSGGPPGRA
jgi:hypothetical protein